MQRTEGIRTVVENAMRAMIARQLPPKDCSGDWDPLIHSSVASRILANPDSNHPDPVQSCYRRWPTRWVNRRSSRAGGDLQMNLALKRRPRRTIDGTRDDRSCCSVKHRPTTLQLSSADCDATIYGRAASHRLFPAARSDLKCDAGRTSR